MFAIMDGKAPVKKVSASIDIKDYRAVYVATKTRESIVISKGEEVVGAIYVSLRMVRDLGVQSDSVEVYGDWELFDWVVTGKGKPEGVEVNWDDRAKGSANKVKGVKYSKLEDASTVKNLAEGLGESIEDILYKTIPMDVLAEDYDLSWTEGKDYRVLIEDDEIYEFIEGLDKTTNIVGFDTETTGLKVNRAKQDKLVGVVMSYEDDSGVYFPILHERFENVKMGEEKLLELLKPYCDRKSPKAKDLVTHNGGFDWRVMKMHDWDLNIVYDTYIRQALRDVSKAKYVRALKKMMEYMFDIDVIELEDMYEDVSKGVIKEIAKVTKAGLVPVNSITKRKLETAENKNDLLDFRFASREFVEIYGPADGDFPRMLHKEMDKDWDPVLDFIYKLEVALIPVIGEQEYYGVSAVREGFNTLRDKTEKKVQELEEKIYKEAGQRFNINSSKQKAEVLFTDLKIPTKSKYKTKSGAWGTGAKVLKELSAYKNDDGSDRYPIAKLLREHSKAQKLLNSFYNKLPVMIQDGSLFSNYNAAGAETGRISCSSPNLQQTESTSREYMVTDTDDHYFMICDYSQVEYRIMAGLADEKKVVDFFTNDAEADYHILAYANMVGKPYEDVTSEERSTGKILNFGTTYGLEDASLAMNLYGNDSMFAQKKAAQARKEYFDGIPDIRDYFEAVRDQAMKDKYAETLFKRRRYIPEFKGDVLRLSEYRRASGRRKAGNHPVQGTAADIMKMAMIRVHRAFKEHGWDENMARLVMNIHDEIVVQVHKSINMWYMVKVMREAMEMDLSKHGIPPLYIGANLGYSWADGKDELEAPVYLMDEKVKWVNEMLEAGKELPVTDDPRKEWQEEIDKFALRVIEEEYQKGYVDKETGKTVEIKDYLDALKNPRLAKYSHHFGKISNKVIFEVIENGVNETYKRIDTLNDYKSDVCMKLLLDIEDEIRNKEIKNYEDVSRSRVILSAMKYFGKYEWNVVDMVKELGAEEVFKDIGTVIKEGKILPIEYEVTEKKEGEDITEDITTVKDYVKKELIKFNGKTNTVTVKLEYDDMDFLDNIESMLIPITNLRAFKEGEKHVNFVWEDERGNKHAIKGYVLFRKMIPIVGKMLVSHVTGVGYKGFKDEIESVGSKLVAV